MAGKVFDYSLAVLLVIAMCFVHSSAQVGCMPAITSLSPCLGYITSSSLTPSDSCCTQVAAVVKTQAQCLCSFLGSSTATQLGTIVNQAQALSLPGACKIDNPLANQCNAASVSQTPVAQSPQEALPPTSQETPSDQTPTNSSTTAVPSSLPIIPAGSGKAGQSSAAGASAKFMPFVLFLLLLASSTSILPAF